MTLRGILSGPQSILSVDIIVHCLSVLKPNSVTAVTSAPMSTLNFIASPFILMSVHQDVHEQYPQQSEIPYLGLRLWIMSLLLIMCFSDISSKAMCFLFTFHNNIPLVRLGTDLKDEVYFACCVQLVGLCEALPLGRRPVCLLFIDLTWSRVVM